MDDQTQTLRGSSERQAIDPAALERLLDLGDEELGKALCAQLISDFSRIDDALTGTDTAVIAKAAHELKGLAATVGATRLADMTTSFDHVVESLPEAARQAIINPIHGELLEVLAQLRAAPGGEHRV